MYCHCTICDEIYEPISEKDLDECPLCGEPWIMVHREKDDEEIVFNKGSCGG